MKKPLVIIAGPTASGKTKTSVALAKKINGEIISADSMQIYKGMDIGTAKVKPDEMEGIKHYMIDEWEPDIPCSVAVFKEKVTAYIKAIHESGKVPILVGGTGFYINAVLFDTAFESEKNSQDDSDSQQAYRRQLEKLLKDQGPLELHEMLRQADPVSAEAIHVNNIKRVMRALMYYHETGEPISVHNKREKEKRFLNESPYDYTFFVLTMERELLYSRINTRIDQMMAQGLLDEVRSLYEKGLDEELPSMKAIGYKEFFPYFKGQADLETCISNLKQNTRHYAKRQLTWFRHQAQPDFIEVDQLQFDVKAIVDEMVSKIKH